MELRAIRWWDTALRLRIIRHWRKLMIRVREQRLIQSDRNKRKQKMDGLLAKLAAAPKPAPAPVSVTASGSAVGPVSDGSPKRRPGTSGAGGRPTSPKKPAFNTSSKPLTRATPAVAVLNVPPTSASPTVISRHSTTKRDPTGVATVGKDISPPAATGTAASVNGTTPATAAVVPQAIVDPAEDPHSALSQVDRVAARQQRRAELLAKQQARIEQIAATKQREEEEKLRAKEMERKAEALRRKEAELAALQKERERQRRIELAQQKNFLADMHLSRAHLLFRYASLRSIVHTCTCVYVRICLR
jgi:hypothetical protein